MDWLVLRSADLLAALLDFGLKSTAFLLIAWGGVICFRKSSASVRCFIWCIALAGLFCIAISTFFAKHPHSGTVAIRGIYLRRPAETPAASAISSAPVESIQRFGDAAPGFFVGTLQAVVSAVRYSNWSPLLVVIWLSGTLAILASVLSSMIRLWHLKTSARPLADERWAGLMELLTKEAGLRKTVPLLQAKNLLMPVAAGCAKPVIFIPPDFENWTADRQRMVLLHELAHVKRRDCSIQLFSWMVCAIYWFNPLVWVALRHLQIERERACDDLVLRRGAVAAEYASHLLALAHLLRNVKGPLASAVPVAKASQLETRLMSILEVGRSRIGVTKSVSILISVWMFSTSVILAVYTTPLTPEPPAASAFDQKIEFETGVNPSDLARADLDDDGRPDLVSVNYVENTVSILQNVSAGGRINYASRFELPTAASPITVEISDLDSDSKPDIIVANHFGHSISVFRNETVGGVLNQKSFATREDFQTAEGPSGAIAADLNGDGRPEIVVANNGHARGKSLSIFENTSTRGRVSFAERIDIETGVQPTFLAVNDVDNDGRPDIAVANHISNTLTLFHNASVGGSLTTHTFSEKYNVFTGTKQSRPYRLLMVDIDSDDKPDIVVGSARAISVHRNTSVRGSLSFAAKVDFTTGSSSAVGLAAGDVNGDGKLDLAVGHLSTNLVSVFLNRSMPGIINVGSFAPKIDLVANQGASGVVISDLNGDGQPDVAVANETASTISVFRNLAGKPNSHR